MDELVTTFAKPHVHLFMEIFALSEGSYTVGLDKIFKPFNPLIDKMSDRPASLHVEIQPFLIHTKSDLILCDTGLGYFNQSGELLLHENIRKMGFDPMQVTKVALSHLHFDHIGGAIINQNGKWQTSFPRAVYAVQKREYETALETPSKSYRSDLIEALMLSGQLELFDGDGQWTPEVSFEITGGHTRYHQAFTFKSDGKTAFFGGDVLPDLHQLIRKFVAKYDFDGKLSAEKRLEFGHRSVQEDSILLFYHNLKVPYCKVAFSELGFRMKA